MLLCAPRGIDVASVPLVADAVAAVGGGNPPIVGTGVANLPFASHGVPRRANISCWSNCSPIGLLLTVLHLITPAVRQPTKCSSLSTALP
eukprot:3998296-Amphidinium_carterae.1